jgi:hypothetical protein
MNTYTTYINRAAARRMANGPGVSTVLQVVFLDNKPI